MDMASKEKTEADLVREQDKMLRKKLLQRVPKDSLQNLLFLITRLPFLKKMIANMQRVALLGLHQKRATLQSHMVEDTVRTKRITGIIDKPVEILTKPARVRPILGREQQVALQNTQKPISLHFPLMQEL